MPVCEFTTTIALKGGGGKAERTETVLSLAVAIQGGGAGTSQALSPLLTDAVEMALGSYP